MTTQKGNKIMNNQEIEQVLNKVEHPNNKFLQLITRWINSSIGMLLNVVALIMIVIAVIVFANKQAVISNLFLLIAGSYILIYELFDLAILKYAIVKKLSEFITNIIGGLIVMSPVIIWMLPFVDNETPLIYKLLLVILVYTTQTWFLGLDEVQLKTHPKTYLDSSNIFRIKRFYLKCKFKGNKLFELVSPYLIRK